MNKLFLALSILCIAAFSACKKSKQSGYPKTYKFSYAANSSQIKQFTKTTEFSGTTSRAAKDSVLNNFSDFITKENQNYNGQKIELLDESKVRITSLNEDTTVSYVRDGEYILVGNLFHYRLSDEAITINAFYGVNYSGNGKVASKGVIGKSDLKTISQEQIQSGDTIASRSYDLIFNRLK